MNTDDLKIRAAFEENAAECGIDPYRLAYQERRDTWLEAIEWRDKNPSLQVEALVNLFQQLVDNCQASIAEEDVSSERRDYRRWLYDESSKALAKWKEKK